MREVGPGRAVEFSGNGGITPVYRKRPSDNRKYILWASDGHLPRPETLVLPHPCGYHTPGDYGGALELHLAGQPLRLRVATIVMIVATLAFALQGIFVAASEAATGDSSHYYIAFAFQHAGEHHSHIIAHRHADGTIHTHAIDDDDGALAKHIKQPGWNMALVVCVVPSPNISALSEPASHKLTIANPRRLWIVDLDGLRRPPRPPSIA